MISMPLINCTRANRQTSSLTLAVSNSWQELCQQMPVFTTEQPLHPSGSEKVAEGAECFYRPMLSSLLSRCFSKINSLVWKETFGIRLGKKRHFIYVIKKGIKWCTVSDTEECLSICKRIRNAQSCFLLKCSSTLLQKLLNTQFTNSNFQGYNIPIS